MLPGYLIATRAIFQRVSGIKTRRLTVLQTPKRMILKFSKSLSNMMMAPTLSNSPGKNGLRLKIVLKSFVRPLIMAASLALMLNLSRKG